MSRPRSKKSIWWLGIIIILIIIAHFLGWLSRPENIISHGLGAIIVNVAKVPQSISGWWQSWQQRQNCQEELQQAKDKINEVSLSMLSYANLVEENQKLRNLLNFQQVSGFKLVTANIVYRGRVGGLLAPDQTFIIDKGSRHGLALDDVVVDDQGAIVGKIGQLKADSAEVWLTTNKNCRLAVTVGGSAETIGVTQGDLGLTIRVDLIPLQLSLYPGQEIISSGLEPTVPKNLVVGKISQIIKADNALWQSAVVEPAVNFSQLNFVSVIIP
jgi:rod shape-determining protein MreC